MKYLSPKQLGQAIGVSESSLKRWIDDGQISVSRTAGGHRRIELPEAVRFVRQRGYTVSDPSVLGLTASDDITGRSDTGQLGEQFHDLLTRGKDKQFIAAVTGLYLAGHGLAELIDGPLRTAMARIGELWHNNPDGVGIEHRATDICIRTLGYLHTLVPYPPEDRPLAVGGAPPGDIHLIPSLCISLVLAEQGWRELNLGANTPWDQFVAVAEREGASLVWCSMTAEPSASRTAPLSTLAQRLAHLPAPLMVGGRHAADQMPRPPHPNLYAANSMNELTIFSRGLLAAHLAKNNHNNGVA